MKLILAEKPSVAKSISTVLNANKREDGFFIGNGYIVSWCIGHLIEFAAADVYDEKYAKWQYDDLPIIPTNWKYTIAKDKNKQLQIISDLSKRSEVDTIICATDAGREGELIFRLVYEYCKCKKPVKRLWISSMEEKAIADGFRNLKEGADFETLYQSALCRSQADWIVGINATRLFSVLYGATLNVGRVMTPTLALIVEREKEISTFMKEPFYMVELNCGTFTFNGEKLKDKNAAKVICDACNGKTALVAAVEKQEKSTLPPKLYDLTTLQREANRLYGFTSQQTLDYVQSLYEKKLATYPRTDSRYLTEDMAAELPTLIENIISVLPFTKGIKLPVDIKCVINNKKVTDHHAIIPTQTIATADLLSLPTGEWNILNMIAVRLICAVGEKYVYNETNITVRCEGYYFSAKGKSVVNSGWKAIEQSCQDALKNKINEDSEDEKELPELTKGQLFECVFTELHEGFTTPPKHFTEDTLLSAMECAGDFSEIPDAERKGLGTPATRAGIIEKLVKTGFIERKNAKKVKHILPTEKGINLITVLPDVIKSPTLTAEWEGKLKQIERGEISCQAFMNGIAEMTIRLVKTNTAASSAFLSLFSANNGNLQNKSIGICPRCGQNIREGNKGFFCENKQCQFALWKDNKFFSSKKKKLTANIAAALLKDGRVFMTGLYSAKTGKTYNSTIILDDTGGKWVNFKMEFEKR